MTTTPQRSFEDSTKGAFAYGMTIFAATMLVTIGLFQCVAGLAALFDDVYGFVLTLLAEPGFTGEICVRYEAGVPIGRALDCRVRLAERDGRKLRMTGELTDAGTVVARSWATFITVDVERMRAGLASS